MPHVSLGLLKNVCGAAADTHCHPRCHSKSEVLTGLLNQTLGRCSGVADNVSHRHSRDSTSHRSFATSAGADYVPKKVERCPVLSLPSKPPDRNIDPRPWKGDHVFYNFHKHTWNHSG